MGSVGIPRDQRLLGPLLEGPSTPVAYFFLKGRFAFGPSRLSLLRKNLPMNGTMLQSSTTTLWVNEIFYSIQGESTFAGKPCIFIRLAGCNLRCTYCDTTYAFSEGVRMGIEEILNQIRSYPCQLVEVTGGEPLLQHPVLLLLRRLCDLEYTVLLETSGALDIACVDPRVHRIMDLKCPSSGECHRNRFANLEHLTARDEVKFVIGTREDFEWAQSQLQGSWTQRVGAILFSPVFGVLEPAQLAAWILEKGLPVRLQIQLHKFIWGPNVRGV